MKILNLLLVFSMLFVASCAHKKSSKGLNDSFKKRTIASENQGRSCCCPTDGCMDCHNSYQGALNDCNEHRDHFETDDEGNVFGPNITSCPL